ncbi:MAG: metallophosphoesterase [Clostridia bacterium]|nr:metallophosphoesterase [Clostridia bacterium]
MDIMKNTDNHHNRVCEIFKDLASKKLYDTWIDSFDVNVVDDKHVSVIYHGSEDIKKFKKECKKVLTFCIYSAIDVDINIKFTKNTTNEVLPSKTRKNLTALKFFILGMLFVCLATAVIVIMCSYIGNRNFRETFYSTSSIKVDSPVRIIQLSDMHGAKYGKDNEKLISRIRVLNPDIIICTGDIVDSVNEDKDYAIALGKELSEIAPSYYIYGNNEVEGIYDVPLNEKELDEKFGFDKNNRDETALTNLSDNFEDELEKTGMKVLKNEKDTIKVKTMTIDVYGVLNSNPSSFWSYSEKAFLSYIEENPGNLKITAVHEPFIFEEFNPEFWGDLMLAGHTHGGVMRIPMLGPLYTTEGGLFPERGGDFVYGRYDAAGKPLIISSGLENNSILRINNQPELVVIDINKF